MFDRFFCKLFSNPVKDIRVICQINRKLVEEYRSVEYRLGCTCLVEKVLVNRLEFLESHFFHSDTYFGSYKIMWLVQHNIWKEYAFAGFMEAIEDEGIPLHVSKIIPFTTGLDPEPEGDPTFVYGSIRMVQLARERGWKVCRDFDADFMTDHPLHLNEGAWTSLLKEVDLRGHPKVFVKPFREKLFTGALIDKPDGVFDLQMGYSGVLDLSQEKVLVSPAYTILREIRIFVVNGEAITGSLYKDLSRGGDLETSVLDMGTCKPLWNTSQTGILC